jgi:tetratricopeptide (TPR) repeat protein
MSFAIVRHCALVAVVATGLAVPCFAADPLGTAGPIRSAGGNTCNGDFAATMRGACDPPPVASTLSAERRSQARVARARSLVALLRMEQAVLELDAAITEDQANSSALLLRGRLKIPARLDEAIRDVNAALQIDPDHADALATRAFLLMGKDDQGGLRDATKALARDPENVDALWIRSLILTRTGRLDEAEKDLNSAAAIEPGNPRTLLSRAEIRMLIGKATEARDDATAVLAIRYDLGALQLRAVVQAKSGDYAAALDDLNAILGPPGDRPVAVALGRDFVDLHIQRAIALTRIGKPSEAKHDLETIVTFGGARAVLQLQLYLRSHGFPDVTLDGKRSDQLDDALRACFINDACGRGITIPG